MDAPPRRHVQDELYLQLCHQDPSKLKMRVEIDREGTRDVGVDHIQLAETRGRQRVQNPIGNPTEVKRFTSPDEAIYRTANLRAV